MKQPCELCGGTGQRSYFKGESRFVLSWDDCPGCCGLGYTEAADEYARNAGATRSEVAREELRHDDSDAPQ
jgi:hypothetical protein